MNTTHYYKSELNKLFTDIQSQNNVGEILKEIYSEWFLYGDTFDNPVTESVCRKIDHFLPQDDGGGPVQYNLY